MMFLDFLFNLIVTATINIIPAFMILKTNGPILKKRNAVITCFIIAIAEYLIAYFIAYSSIGSGITPKGFAEFLYAYINYQILYAQPLKKKSNALPYLEVKFHAKDTADEMDESMKAYAEILLPEEKEGDDKKELITNKSNSRLKSISIILSIILACSVGINIYLISNQNALISENSKNKELIEAFRTNNDKDYENLQRAKIQLDHYFSDFAYSAKNDGAYHKLRCPFLDDGGTLYVDCIPDWKVGGYKECSFCYGKDFTIFN